MHLQIYSVSYRIRGLSWLRGHGTWVNLVVKECPSVPVVYLVIYFKNGTGKELGDCKCGAQTPESGDMVECVWVGVHTEYHYHLLSDGGLRLYL